MRIRTVLPAILLMMTGACTGQEPNGILESPGAGPALVIASPAWAVPAKYVFTFDSQCGERALLGRFRVTVQDDAVVHAEGLDDAARGAVTARTADLVPTLRQLEAQADTARRAGAHVAEVERSASDGHPTKITIDPSRTTIDDEVCYTIEDYTIGLLSRPAPSPSR